MRVAIVPAGEADLPAIKTLLSELLDAMDNTEGLDIAQAEVNCREMMRDPSYHFLVARKDNHILGFISFSARKTVLHRHESGLIDELVVSKSSRGAGIGRQLVLAVIDGCRKLGCSEVEVSTEKSNRQARRFYQACGFEEEAVLLERQLE